MKSEKTEEKEVSNQKSIRTLGDKKNTNYHGIFEADSIGQTEMEKSKKGVSQRSTKITWDKTLQQKSHQNDRYLALARYSP